MPDVPPLNLPFAPPPTPGPTPTPPPSPFKVPGGGVDAPDPFLAQPGQAPRPTFQPTPQPQQPPQVPPSSSVPKFEPLPPTKVSETTPLAPPAFRKPNPTHRGRRLIVLFSGGLLVIVLLAVLGWVGVQLLLGDPTEEETATPVPSTQTSVRPSTSAHPSTSAPAGAAIEDPDSDGLTNAEEDFYSTDPAKADSDDDRYKDGDEVRAGFDPLGPGKLDSDNDGFPDPDERSFGSDPFNPDTDGDGFSDGKEIRNGYNPLIPSPNDKL